MFTTSAFVVPHLSQKRLAQKGFSLIEVSIVTAIVLLLAIIGIPAIGGYVVENKVPKVGEELARFIVQTKVNAPSGATNPYLGLDHKSLATMVRDSSIFTVSGTGQNAKIYHGLGSGGEVSVSSHEDPVGFSVSLSNVNHAACPSIASVMQRVADKISVTPSGGALTPLKGSDLAYSALTAQEVCAKGDVNKFEFTVG